MLHTSLRKKALGAALAFLMAATLAAGLTGCGNTESIEESAVSSSVSTSAPSSSQAAPAKDRDIDFEALAAQNEDVVAWVEVPGSNVDYPVVYSDDNSYYLNHDLDGNYYVGGSIFLDMENSRQLGEPLTVIYGHFMPDDSLFTQLHRYEDRGYFDEHPAVNVYTPEHQFKYSIVAALAVDDRYIFYNMDTGEYIDYSSPDDVQYFLDWVTGTRDLSANVDMDDCTVDDQYLVLSTCTSLADSNDRYIVVAKQESVI